MLKICGVDHSRPIPDAHAPEQGSLTYTDMHRFHLQQLLQVTVPESQQYITPYNTIGISGGDLRVQSSVELGPMIDGLDMKLRMLLVSIPIGVLGYLHRKARGEPLQCVSPVASKLSCGG